MQHLLWQTAKQKARRESAALRTQPAAAPSREAFSAMVLLLKSKSPVEGRPTEGGQVNKPQHARVSGVCKFGKLRVLSGTKQLFTSKRLLWRPTPCTSSSQSET